MVWWLWGNYWKSCRNIFLHSHQQPINIPVFSENDSFRRQPFFTKSQSFSRLTQQLPFYVCTRLLRKLRYLALKKNNRCELNTISFKLKRMCWKNNTNLLYAGIHCLNTQSTPQKVRTVFTLCFFMLWSVWCQVLTLPISFKLTSLVSGQCCQGLCLFTKGMDGRLTARTRQVSKPQDRML